MLGKEERLRWSQFFNRSGQLLVSTDGPTFSGLMTASSIFTSAPLIVTIAQDDCPVRMNA